MTDIYAVKTVVGRENIVIENMISNVKKIGLSDVDSFIHPQEIKGYVFVEGNLKAIEMAIIDVPHLRGMIKKPIKIQEIERYLQPKTVEVKINIGDIIEVVGGPFKSERGKITKFDKDKREITMELLESAVPIPITISVEFIKVLEKSNND